MDAVKIQIALDFTELPRALEAAGAALRAGADWLEIGQPLIKFEGVRAIEAVSRAFPQAYLLADFMTLSNGSRYAKAAQAHGAKNMTVSGLAPDITVLEAIEAGKRHGVQVTVDLFQVFPEAGVARKYAAMGADFVMVHYNPDQRRQDGGLDPIARLREVRAAVDLPVAFAVYDLESARNAVKAGADVIVAGAPWILEQDLERSLRTLTHAVRAAE